MAAAPTIFPQLAYTGAKGNIFISPAQQGQAQQLTWGWEEQASSHPDQTDPKPLSYVWPTWAPDGSRLACFGLRGAAGPNVQTSIFAIAADGIESWELAHIAGGMPIYANWSPRSDILTVLIQRGEAALSLEAVCIDRPGQMLTLLHGAPLFWSWSPRGDRIAVHVGGSHTDAANARVLLLEPTSGQVVREISTHPGHFRVPSWSPTEDLLVYTEQQEEGGDMLRLFDVASGETGPVALLKGSVAAVWSPDGQALAFGSTSRPGALLFSHVQILDLTTGKITPLLEESVTGFFWAPDGKALFSLSVDVQHSHLCWHRTVRASGEKTELARFLPSREQTFILSFFDQYAFSHPPLSPDGSALAFAGHQIGPVALDTSSASQIYIVPLDHPDAFYSIGAGNFVCWQLG